MILCFQHVSVVSGNAKKKKRAENEMKSIICGVFLEFLKPMSKAGTCELGVHQDGL